MREGDIVNGVTQAGLKLRVPSGASLAVSRSFLPE